MRYLLYAGLALFLLSLLTGLTQVRPNERAVVRRFGRVLDEKPGPGLWIGLPWGIDQVERVPVDLVQGVTVGFDPEEEETEEVIPPGQLVTGDRNLVNVRVVINYMVNGDEVEKYVVQKERASGLVARAVEALLAEWAAGLTVDDVLRDGKAVLPKLLVEQTQERIAAYGLGIRIQDASVALLAPPARVKDAFDKVNEAQTAIQTRRFEAERDRSQKLGEAETERDRLVKEAEAFVVEQRWLAQTDAANFLKRLREYRRFREKNGGDSQSASARDAEYRHDIWFNEIKKIYARMRENGGRVEPLDKLLGREAVDIIQAPIKERKR
jgi:membrane protease subunit HflK